MSASYELELVLIDTIFLKVVRPYPKTVLVKIHKNFLLFGITCNIAHQKDTSSFSVVREYARE